MTTKTIQSCLGALKKSGSVFGVILARENQIVYADVPFSNERVSHVANVLDDIQFYFKKENRHVDQLAFGFDGGNMVIVADEDYRIIVFHSLSDEVDLIAKSAKSFLLDYQMGLFASEFQVDQNQERAIESVSPEPRQMTPEEAQQQAAIRPGTQRITLKAESGFDDTQPLQPHPNGAP